MKMSLASAFLLLSMVTSANAAHVVCNDYTLKNVFDSSKSMVLTIKKDGAINDSEKAFTYTKEGNAVSITSIEMTGLPEAQQDSENQYTVSFKITSNDFIAERYTGCMPEPLKELTIDLTCREYQD